MDSPRPLLQLGFFRLRCALGSRVSSSRVGVAAETGESFKSSPNIRPVSANTGMFHVKHSLPCALNSCPGTRRADAAQSPRTITLRCGSSPSLKLDAPSISAIASWTILRS